MRHSELLGHSAATQATTCSTPTKAFSREQNSMLSLTGTTPSQWCVSFIVVHPRTLLMHALPKCRQLVLPKDRSGATSLRLTKPSGRHLADILTNYRHTLCKATPRRRSETWDASVTVAAGLIPHTVIKSSTQTGRAAADDKKYSQMQSTVAMVTGLSH